MGLGKSNKTKATYLSFGGGFIWNKKAEESHEDYAVQPYEMPDGTKKERKGAQYDNLTGKIVSVQTRTHDEYGDSIAITISSGGELYILSSNIDSRYAGDLMKALLVIDFEEVVTITPYDFISSEKKRMMGVSFKQGGQKLNLKIEGQPTKEKEWFKAAAKRDIKRFFEDVTDYFKERVTMEILPQFEGVKPEAEEDKSEKEVESDSKGVESDTIDEKEVGTAPKMTPLKMKKFLRTYLKENYPGEELPTLEKAELIKWYELAQAEEELPIGEEDKVDDSQQDNSDVESQLDALMGN